MDIIARWESYRLSLWAEVRYLLPRIISEIMKNGNSKLKRILENTDLVFCMYWSDWRIEKINTKQWGLDIIAYTKSLENIDIVQVRNALNELITQTIKSGDEILVSWYEWELLVNRFNTWDLIWRLNTDSLIIKWVNDNDLYLFPDNNWIMTYPDVIIDSIILFWKPNTLKAAKMRVATDFISNPGKLLKDYFDSIKDYFKKKSLIDWRNLRWSNRQWNTHHHLLSEKTVFFNPEKWLYWFKYWPLRAIQYLLTYKTLEYISKIDSKSYLIEYSQPFQTSNIFDRRLEFISNIWVFEHYNDSDYKRLTFIYNYFRALQYHIESLQTDWDSVDKLLRESIIWTFVEKSEPWDKVVLIEEICTDAKKYLHELFSLVTKAQ